MFNVTILRMRDLIKYFVGIIITVIVVIFLTKYFLSNKIRTKVEGVAVRKFD